MKKLIALTAVLALTAAALVGCSNAPAAATTTTATTTAAQTTTAAETTTAALTTTTAAQTTTVAEEETDYEGDAVTIYVDTLYHQQLDLYFDAITGSWDAQTCADKGVSQMLEDHYGDDATDALGYALQDLDNDGSFELLIGVISEKPEDAVLLSVWTLKGDEPVELAVSQERSRYYLEYSQEDDAYFIANHFESGADSYGYHFYNLLEGKLNLVQGVIYDALESPDAPWFMTGDEDFDVTNDTAIDADMADSIIKSNTSNTVCPEFIPFSLYR